jgi:hypothetical protein
MFCVNHHTRDKCVATKLIYIIKRIKVTHSFRKLNEVGALIFFKLEKCLKLRFDVVVVILSLKVLFFPFIRKRFVFCGLSEFGLESRIHLPRVGDVFKEEFELDLLDALL